MDEALNEGDHKRGESLSAPRINLSKCVNKCFIVLAAGRYETFAARTDIMSHDVEQAFFSFVRVAISFSSAQSEKRSSGLLCGKCAAAHLNIALAEVPQQAPFKCNGVKTVTGSCQLRYFEVL